VAAARVVEAFEVVENRDAGLGAGWEALPVEQLAFQGDKEALGDRVVRAVPGPSHGGDQPGLAQLAAERRGGVLPVFKGSLQH
jgi:hypothetical protein